MAPEVTAGSTPYVFDFTEGEAGGYTFSGSVSLGSPTHPTPGLTEGTLVAGSACDIDDQTDAVIPGVVNLTNTTSGFNTQATVTMDWSSESIVGIEAGYSNGPTCDGDQGSGTDEFGLQSNDALAPNSGIETDIFIVISDYYTPDHPHGDKSLLEQADLTLVDSSTSSGNTISPDGLTGPGVTSADDDEIPLASTTGST